MNQILQNAVIVGGSGMVGSNIPFGKKPTSLELDISNKSSVEDYFSRNSDASCLINLVSLNLRDCEKYPLKAIHINVNGTLNLLEISKKLEIPFVLISSGAVFSSDNPNQKFSETDLPNPNCIYGSTKYSAENIALTYDKTILIRTGWLFGGNQKSHYKFVEHAYNNIVNNKPITCCKDFYGSSTYVIDLISKIEELISKNMFGIHHVVNEGTSTGVSVGEYIAHLLDKPLTLIDHRTFSEIPNCGPLRSSSEVLITNNSFNNIRDWKSALKEYIVKLNRFDNKIEIIPEDEATE
jgi:dTDP-4-dehydrorhamnose reductase